jgi:hypothetical protein
MSATLAAISITGAHAQHINSGYLDCVKKYGPEVKSFKETNAGNLHYFTANDLLITVITNCTKVKEIQYRKLSGDQFSTAEIDILQQKNQQGILGGDKYEWAQDFNVPDGYQVWTLSRLGKVELQAFQVDDGKTAYVSGIVATKDGRPELATTKKTAFVLVIRTQAQIAVDIEGAKQDKIDQLGNL